MLVLSRNAYTKDDTLWLNVVFEDGTAKEIEIDEYSKSTFNPEDTTCYMNAYAYVENADGTYDIVDGTRIEDYNAELLLNGTVENTKNEIYALPDDADIWDVTDMKNAEDDVREGEFSYIECHSVIVPTTVNGRTIRTAFVWEIDDTTETPEQGAKFTNYVDEDETTGEIELYYHGNVPKTSEVKELTADYLNEEVKSARQTMTWGGRPVWEVTTVDGDEWDVYPVRVNSVSYNGQTRWVRNGTNDLINHDDVVFSASDDLENGKAVLIQKASINVAGVRTETLTAASGLTTPTVNYDGDKFTYVATVSNDLELADAYKVHTDNIYRELTDGTDINNDYYVAEGTEVVLTSGRGLDAGYYYFDFGDGKVGEYHYADSTTSFPETMTVTAPINVKMSKRAALVTYNGDEVGEGYYEAGEMAIITTTFSTSDTSMKLLHNSLIGSSIQYTLKDYANDIRQAGNTTTYKVNMDDIDARGTINFYDGAVFTATGATLKVGTDSKTSGGCVAVGEEVTVTADSGKVIKSVMIGSDAVELTSGSLDTDEVSFVVPAVDSDSITITVQ